MFEKILQKILGKKKEDPVLKDIEDKGYQVSKQGDAYVVQGKGEHGITIKECNLFAYLRQQGYELKREEGRLYIRPKDRL
ncbi:hypothetical protein FJZ53_07550 [Candidatus Woesearchaeota archaeon]|nr:hypothetical protein [Candidatus Woesearchaeota archaeon]